MNQTTYTVYWTYDGQAHSRQFTDMNVALFQMEVLRKDPGNRAVTFCSENPNQVGKPGVDAVKDGVLPDGTEYLWAKRRDGVE